MDAALLEDITEFLWIDCFLPAHDLSGIDSIQDGLWYNPASSTATHMAISVATAQLIGTLLDAIGYGR